MSSQVVLSEKINSYATVLTLNRPERRNALSIELMHELGRLVEAGAQDPSQRVLILRGAGEVFCAGLDLKEASEAGKTDNSAHAVARTLLAVHGSPLITIAAVHGAAMAGGAGIMSCCDFVVCAEGAKIGYPEVRRGLVAALVLTFLQRQLGERHLRELLLLAEPIDAARAHEIGLINRIVPATDVMSEALKIAAICVQGAPQAIANTKRLLSEFRPPSVPDDINKAIQSHLGARSGDEAVEGIAAFLQKRPPKWVPPSI
jgi:methylglutaconyl-CoA hydratase